MAHLDLEEQEQLDQVKHFWNTWGNLITWGLIAVLAAYAAWNGWRWWQRSQGTQAAALYEQVEQAALAGDVARVERSFGDIKDKAASTVYAQQAGLLAAKVMFEKDKPDEAKAALGWVAEKTSDEGLRAVARLRLAAVLTEAKSFDAALAQLSGNFPASFAPLVADRKGDLFNLQGKKTEAVAEYRKALAGLDAGADYRKLVEVKLVALGIDPKAETGLKTPAVEAKT